HPRLLDDEEIGSNALIVLFGGIETTEAMIANALWAMLSHPPTLARARTSTADLMACVEESLRWDAAVQTATRYAAPGATVHGVAIPEGDLVQCMLGAANRDPAHYADPDRYDPWRPATVPHLAFAFGRHFCLGAAVARVEAEVALASLLAAWPEAALDHGRSRSPTGHEFRKPAALWLRRSAA
ncbi:MAG: cytochrome P450, partial [Gemmatimonadetes bacterium]|nr:cytochrome P450 [Gemmatimonadota bacterium]